MKLLLAPLAILALGSSAPAAVILFDLQGKAGFGMIAGNENAAVTGTPGSGGEIGSGIRFDNVSKVLTINIGWGVSNGFTNLTGVANGAHIHGPATLGSVFTTDAPVVVNFLNNAVTTGYTSASFTTNTSASAGTVSGTVILDATREAQLMASQLYLNVHTPTNGGGEIRGNMVVVPEPSTALLAGFGLLGLTLRRRHRA